MRTRVEIWTGALALAATLIAFPGDLSAAEPSLGGRLARFERRFPQCAGLLSAAEVGRIARQKEDPLVAHERIRVARQSSARVPPDVVCASKAWRYAKGLIPEASAPAEEPIVEGAASPYQAQAAAIGENVPLDFGVDGYQGEAHVAIDPNNPQRLVAGANTSFHDPASSCQSPTGGSNKTLGTMALYGSSDGGLNWTYRCAPWPASLIGGVPGADKYLGSDPVLAWDGAGRAYAAYMLLSANSVGDAMAAIVVARSTDAGQTWSPWGTVTGWGAHDKPTIAIDPATNRVYVAWSQLNFVGLQKMVTAWSDDGATWTATTFNQTPIDRGLIGVTMAVGGNGTVYAVWNAAKEFVGDQLWFSKSTDGGSSWSNQSLVRNLKAGSFPAYSIPAQDGRGVNAFSILGVSRQSLFYSNRLYLAYMDATVDAGGSLLGFDIYAIHSGNGGITWSAPVKVNDDAIGKDHFLPSLAVDQSDGSVHVAWYDTRGDANKKRAQIYYARSIDGGQSFEPNLLLNGDSTYFPNHVSYSNQNSAANPNGDHANQYGDYLGVVAANRKAWVAWADTRQFFPNQQPWSLTVLEDIASVRVTHCTAPSFTTTPSASVPGLFMPVSVSWAPASSWGTNATTGSYYLYRFSGAGCSGSAAYVATLPAGTTSKVDAPPATGTYSYKVSAINNCPGTWLTAMSVLSPCSNAVSYSKLQL